MTVKRSREESEIETSVMANCLMLLSRVGENPSIKEGGRMFECKTCKRQFHSFQALGGHRASHKKLRLMASDLINQSWLNRSKPHKKHECSICGLEFKLGQALGGHMRRHRAAMDEDKAVKMVPVLKRSNSKRIFVLDLNLTPCENDLQLGKMAPVLDF